MNLGRQLLAAGTALITMAAGGSVATTRAPAANSAGSRAVVAAGVDAKVRGIMAKMSLADKVGQMFVTYAYGDTATTEASSYVTQNQKLYGVDNGAQLLARYHLGGVIYFSWAGNLANPTQIAGLSNQLQQESVAADGIPVQISTDQEGGYVNRIGAPAAVSPGNMALGATGNPLTAYQVAKTSGTELRAMGINVDDAPVVDVNTNPQNTADGVRSFGDRTLPVAAFGAAAVRGYQDAGVGAQAKHFPGLGDTTVNTDNGIAITNETREQILATHIPPFAAAIAAGTRSVMVAHIVAPSLDPSGLPASLSQPIVTGMLRGLLHYDGVVITDSLSADALAQIPAAQIILDAVNAGDDELLMPADLPGAINTVINAVNSGQISQARIDSSVYRILRMKAELGLLDNPYTDVSAVDSVVGAQAHLDTMADAADKSITLLRNDGTLPLAANSGKNVFVTGWGASAIPSLATNLAGRGVNVTSLYTGTPSQATIAQAVAKAGAADVTVVTTGNAWNSASQQSLVNALLATGKPVVVVSLEAPYDIAYFSSAPTYLAAYDYQPVSVAAVANTLFGTAPTGKLPVTVKSVDGTKTIFGYGTSLHY